MPYFILSLRLLHVASYPGHPTFFNAAREWPGYEATYMHDCEQSMIVLVRVCLLMIPL